MVRRPFLTITECARVLGTSVGHTYRLVGQHRHGRMLQYEGGRAVYRVAYDADAIYELARARDSVRCVVCGSPARPTAYTCGKNTCACIAYKRRRKAYREARA
jgi:hypothetical protein